MDFKANRSTVPKQVTKLSGLRQFFEVSQKTVDENPDLNYAVIVMDIAQFKAVNEFCGRDAGDALLVFIGDMFKEYADRYVCSCAAHARADNFVLMVSYDDPSEVVSIVEEMYEKITEYPLPYKVVPSFGICYGEEKPPYISGLKDSATLALNEIKGKFYARYRIFDESMRKNMLNEKQVQNDIISALKNSELKMFIQPKVDMRTKEVYGGESLIRWIHPELGMISPGSFIPVLEKNGFIIQVDYFIWEQVFKYLRKLKDEGRQLIPISINISRLHVYDENMCDKLVGFTKKYDIPPEYVPLELTESAFTYDANEILKRMNYLREQGFKISMDDFGTGYSSMQMLASLPLDEIKIDRSFVINLGSERGRIILEHITMMLRDLRANYIVEGVETEAQRRSLVDYGCFRAQGFLFHRPMSMEDFDKLLLEQDMKREEESKRTAAAAEDEIENKEISEEELWYIQDLI